VVLRRLTNLKARRKRRGLTQEDLAALTGISRSTIAELEGGRRKARPATTTKLAAALRTKPEKLY
jgi:transcriptional regulator with XRE-family HTH domain